MANLLRWSVGMALPKKDENTNLITSLRTFSPTISRVGGSTANNGTSNLNTVANTSNSLINRTQQINNQIRQQAERRRQEEQQRQQRLAEQQRQQEQRKQQEAQRKLQQQQAQQQKQRNLLSSAGLGGNFLQSTDLRAQMASQRQAQLRQQQQNAAKKLQQQQAEQQANQQKQAQLETTKSKYNNMFKDEGNGWSNNSFWTSYRDNGSKAYKYNSVYWESQQDLNRALRTIMSKDDDALGDADRIVSAYSKLSNDEKWSAYQDLQKAANKIQQVMAKADNEGNTAARDSYGQALDYINTYQNLISGIDKGDKSFWKSLTDTAQSGGFIGDMAQPFVNALGDVTGRSDVSKRIENDNSTAKAGNNGVVAALDKAGGMIGNVGLNVVTGGKYGLGTAAMNVAHEGVSALNDQDREYYIDANGNVQRQNATNEQKISSIGGAGFNLGMSLLGMAGKGPNIEFANGQTLQGLISNKQYGELAKGLLTYTKKEIPFALGTTAGDTFIQSIGQGKEAWNNYGENLLNNIVGDLSMDIAGAMKYGRTGDRDLFRVNQDNGKLELDDSVKSKLSAEDNAKVQQRLDEFQEGVKQAAEQQSRADLSKVNNDVELGKVQTTNDGSMVKVNDDGSKSRLSNAELANVIEQESKQTTVTGKNPFMDNSVKITSTSDDVEALTKLAAQGNEYAKQRLAELTKAGEAEEQTDWRGKTVDEAINPERAELTKTLEMLRGTDLDVNPEKTRASLADQNSRTLANMNQDELLNTIADANPALYDYLESQGLVKHGLNFNNETSNRGEYRLDTDNLTNGQRQKIVELLQNEGYGRDDGVRFVNENEVSPNQASLLDSIDVTTAREMENRPQLLPNERALGTDQEYVRYNPQETTKTQLTPAAEDLSAQKVSGTTDASTRVPTVDETSTTTPEQALAGYRESLAQNNNESVSREALKNLADTLDIGLKDGAQKIPDTNMEKKSGQNLNPKVVGIDEFFTGVTEDNARSFRKKAFDLAASLFNNKQVVVEDTGTSTQINRKGLRKTFSDNTPPSKIQSANKIGQIVEQGIYRYTTANPNSTDGILYHHFFTPVSYGGENGVVRTVIKEYTNEPSSTNKYYYHQMELLDGTKSGGTPSITPSRRTNVAHEGSASNDSILSQNGENVNGAKSQFAENTSGNRNFSNETRSELKSDPLTYKPTTNEERLARANEILSTKSSDEIDNYLRENFFNVKPKNADSADMVLAGEYAKMLDAKGQYDRSTEIINKMSEIGTKQGQNIQALSLMMNRSPEGIANMAQTAIKKGGGEMTPELRKQIVGKTQEIGRTRGERAKLADENAKISEQIMNGKGDLTALRKRQMEIGQAYRLNIDQEGRQFSQLADVVGKNSPDKRSVFGSIWRAGLLSGPRTHTGNAVSNTFQNVLNAGSDRIAAGLDWARSKITGTERQVVTSAGGRMKGLKRGLKAAGEVLKTGDNLWDGMDATVNKTDAWGQGGELEFKNKIADTMVAKPTNFVFRAMSAGDLPFRYQAFENAIRTEAKRQGINKGYKGQALQDYINSRVATPDPELQAYGMKKGNESVYDVDTKLSDIMTRVDKFIDSQDNKIVKNGMKVTKTLIAPFVKVPSKVLSTAIDYSPLGAVKAIVNKVGSKGYTTGQFESDLSKSGLGTTGFVGLGYALSAAGLLTGGYPEDADERNRWKAEGIEPNSIKIGDKYISLNYLGPASMLMAMGSGVQQRQAKGEDALTITQGVLTDTMNTFLDQSYVQGLSNALNAITDSQRYGESYINSFARGLVPNLLRQTAVATDPKQRQTNNVGDAIVSGIPGLSQTLDAKVDVYGREIENKQTLPLGQAWDALKISNSRETNDVIDEVNRLHNVDPGNKDLQVTPPTQSNNLSVNGVSVKLTDEQKTQLQKDIGEAAITAMRQVMQSSSYANMTDEQKASALDKARQNAQTEARKQFIEANGITGENNPGTKNSGGSVSGDYASKAITSATSTRTNGAVTVNDSISDDSKSILGKYNSMNSDDWNDYLYGTSAEAAAAEYKLAKAKYENDLANGKLTEPQRIKKEKELAKLAVSQKWTKDYRDAYSLAGTKADMQAFLNELDDETRAKTVATLNGLNNAMYEAGIITASTYKTRANAINNTTSSKSSGSRKSSSSKSGGISSAEASALADLAKTMVKNTNTGTTKKSSAPTTNRKMAGSKSGGGSSGLKTYQTKLAKNASVAKGANRSIA